MIPAASIGQVARNWLGPDQEGWVMGVTSRGVFLLLEGGRVIFLSTEPYPGPLTVNLPDGDGLLAGFEQQTHVRINGQTIQSSNGQLVIDTRPAKTWLPPARPQKVLSLAERRAGLDRVTRQLFPGQVNGFGSMLAQFPGMQEAAGVNGRNLIHNLDEAWLGLFQGNEKHLVAALKPLLGYGPGLTPGGDDVVLGALLAMNRWGDVLAPVVDARALNTTLVAEAIQRTTSLSASLIACAAEGQADARLITGLDGLVCGFEDLDTLCMNFSSWGSTSGSNALVGMAMVLLS